MSGFSAGPPREILPGAHPRLRPPDGLRSLLDLEFTSVAVGHGEPILGTAKVELRAYLKQATRDG